MCVFCGWVIIVQQIILEVRLKSSQCFPVLRKPFRCRRKINCWWETTKQNDLRIDVPETSKCRRNPRTCPDEKLIIHFLFVLIIEEPKSYKSESIVLIESSAIDSIFLTYSKQSQSIFLILFKIVAIEMVLLDDSPASWRPRCFCRWPRARFVSCTSWRRSICRRRSATSCPSTQG